MRLISSLLFAAALASPAAAQDDPDRYTIEISVFVAGTRVASASTTIVDGGQANLLHGTGTESDARLGAAVDSDRRPEP